MKLLGGGELQSVYGRYFFNGIVSHTRNLQMSQYVDSVESLSLIYHRRFKCFENECLDPLKHR